MTSRAIEGPLHSSDGRVFDSHQDLYQDSYYSKFPQEYRSGGSLSLSMTQVEQDEIDLIDAPLPEVIFWRVNAGADEAFVDVGDGRRRHISGCDHLSVVPANTEVRYRVEKFHSLRLVGIREDRLKSVLEEAGSSIDALAPHWNRARHMKQASKLLDTMWENAEGERGIPDIFLDGLTLQFIAAMCADHSLSPVASGYVENERIARVIEYIEAHCGEAVGVTELAAIAHMSPSHFSQCFKSTIGETVWTYVQRRRCERAAHSLRHSRQGIAEIAYDCGFANQAHLTKAFKRQYNVTPGAYRTQFSQ